MSGIIEIVFSLLVTVLLIGAASATIAINRKMDAVNKYFDLVLYELRKSYQRELKS